MTIDTRLEISRSREGSAPSQRTVRGTVQVDAPDYRVAFFYLKDLSDLDIVVNALLDLKAEWLALQKRPPAV